MPEQLASIQQAHPDKQLNIFFQDEARFGQQGTLTRVWAKTGSRATAVRQTQYQYLYVIGAVCPQTGQAEGLFASRINTDTINLFLRQFSRTIPTGVQAVLIWDGAGFHRSKQMVVPENISLIQLPPYSPELNPIENLWHYLRSHYWSNRFYADLDEVEEAAQAAWDQVCLDPNILKTVCHAPYLDRAVIT